MARVKVTKRTSAQEIERRKETPVIVYLCAFGLGFLSYVVARVVLDGKPHPYHWLAGLIGGIVGIGIGWLWYRWRGDVV